MGTFDAVMREAGDDLVDAVVTVRRGEAAKLLAVLRMVDAYPAPESLELPASERVVPVGAAGAGVVGEYVALEVSTLLGVSVPVASNLIRDAANLRSRHPRLWGRVIGLQVEVWQAREVARACHELSADAAGWVDEHLDGVWGTVPWSRVRRRLNGLVVRADRELAARKAELGRRDRFVSIRHLGDSTSVLIAKIDTAAALRLGQLIARTVDRLAKDGHDESLPELRAQALEMLGTPQLLAADAEEAGPTAVMSDGQRPLADLVVHVGAEDLDPGATGTQVARVVACGGDVGPVLLSQVEHLLGHHRVRVIPVIDLAGDSAVDQYEIPTRMRRQLTLREDCSVFPFSGNRSRSCDLDHSAPFRFSRPGAKAPPGQTRISNLGPLSRFEHRAKTAGTWHLEQPVAGLYLWTSRYGDRYAVIGGHTHRLPAVPSATLERV